ncbi:tetratricopeptide repeat protein [Pontibacter sp. E15-1]|uniref:type IX secretion system periplasmic lipoprotein PorW/SprE n=1 Tax=Pontibacter sp. E15-1 TaxID=2919918 RepID=UPI001F4FA4D9|nr:tetratricopeptide repeat protein [Pontibacter sp. E15-1]MCJ8166138.1 tetratricopeptide repeat protein [Pontibacter sp. E15-1]
MNRNSLHILFILAAMLLVACSAERNNPLSKTYHNTAARYNGYFLAREKMRLMQESLQEQTQYDYNQVLPIYPAIDSTTAKAFEADLEDIKKKASHPIQYHKNSKWIDNSYIEIGKANYYQLNFAEAVRTFKYVNATSKDADDRHEALVWLMRAFIQLEEMDNAQQVSEFLRKERLNKANARELYLVRAHYYRLQADTAQVIENLALSLPNFEDKDAQSRVRYTLGQLYQLTDQRKEAYQEYSKVLRRNPPFDLGFFSRLNLGQVSELTDEQDKERIAGYYQKLLKDEKNLEYRDRIYYEMAQFELRQSNHDKALELLQQSLRTPGVLSNQKAYSYVSAGEIYFDHLNKYDLAAAYYDSAVQVYPQRAPEYEAVAERRDILADFARQYSTIQTQDSLQRLGRMSEADRMAFVQALVAREEEAQQLELARQQELAKSAEAQPSRNNRRNQNGDAFNASGSASSVWYFDNPTAMASARAEFVRRWGERPLQDFWRIRIRGEAGSEANIARAPVMNNLETQLSPEERSSAQLDAYLQGIPLTTVDLQRSEKLVEEALFRLANIYAQNLNDTARAEQTYVELLRLFPKSEHSAEAYYSLYLLYGKAGNMARQQVYYKKLKEEFPNTTFARLLDDEDFLSKNAVDNRKAQALYDSAYSFYSAQEYEQATKVLHQVVSQYPLNDIKDKISFLEALVTARTQKPELLQRQLQQFQKDYPGSPLQPQAAQLLATYTELEQNNLLRNDAPAPPQPAQPNTAARLTPEQKVSTEIARATASAAKATPELALVEKSPKPLQQTPEPPRPEAEATPKPEQAAEQKLPVATPPASTTDTVAATLPSPPPVAADPLAYEVAPDSAYYFVLLYPTDAAAFKDILPKYEKYNSTYFKNDKLTIDAVAFDGGKTMLLLRSFSDPKTALSFNIKQKAPQAPVGRIRGIDFTTFVISAANYQKFLQKKDLEAYMAFFKNNY